MKTYDLAKAGAFTHEVNRYVEIRIGLGEPLKSSL
jgi:hypothetical protein